MLVLQFHEGPFVRRLFLPRAEERSEGSGWHLLGARMIKTRQRKIVVGKTGKKLVRFLTVGILRHAVVPRTRVDADALIEFRIVQFVLSAAGVVRAGQQPLEVVGKFLSVGETSFVGVETAGLDRTFCAVNLPPFL